MIPSAATNSPGMTHLLAPLTGACSEDAAMLGPGAAGGEVEGSGTDGPGGPWRKWSGALKAGLARIVHKKLDCAGWLGGVERHQCTAAGVRRAEYDL
jgi:hypothetical protein